MSQPQDAEGRDPLGDSVSVLRARPYHPLRGLNPSNGRDRAHSIEYLIFIGQLSSNSPTCIFLLPLHAPSAIYNFQFGTRYYELHQYPWHNPVTCCLPRAGCSNTGRRHSHLEGRFRPACGAAPTVSESVGSGWARE